MRAEITIYDDNGKPFNKTPYPLSPKESWIEDNENLAVRVYKWEFYLKTLRKGKKDENRG